jgi:hypothetical protein
VEEDARSTHGQTDLLIAELQYRVRSLEETNGEKRHIIAALTQRIPAIEAPENAPESPEPQPDRLSSTTQASEGAQEGLERPWWRRVFGS